MAKTLIFPVEVYLAYSDPIYNIEIEIPEDITNEVTEYIAHCQKEGDWDQWDFSERFPEIYDNLTDIIYETISDCVYVDDVENNYADLESKYDSVELYDMIFSDKTQEMDIPERAEYYRTLFSDYDEPENLEWDINMPSIKVD